MHEAKLYTKNPDGSVKCFLCRHLCHIKTGQTGICKVRENTGGTLYSIFYGKPCALAVDPIEKKPLFHYRPGSLSFSVATLGCNFQCPFCQNWDISQYGRIDTGRFPSTDATPENIVDAAIAEKCSSISYTYSEPTIFYEYARDIAELATTKGIDSIFVTNGYMTREMLNDFHPLLKAANVDLKAFKPETYKKEIKADLNGVLDSIRAMKEKNIWIEITTLVVPGMNDDPAELKDIANFIASVGKEIPWHISRFHPQFKFTNRHSTPADILRKAYEIGKEAGLRYVYLGNVAGDETENTFCYNCGERLIERTGFSVRKNLIVTNGKCTKCGCKIDGRW